MAFFSFLIVAWIVLLAILLWDLIQKGQNKIYMFILIPASLLLTVTTYITIQGLLGYPTEQVRPGKFILVSSAVKEPDWVFYWVVHQGEHEPVAYKVPYTQPEHKKQEEASEAQQRGQTVAGEMIEEEVMTSDGSPSRQGHLEFYEFDYTKQDIPKN
jgi:carbon starvation protein CstA